jgi:hypothetical protein
MLGFSRRSARAVDQGVSRGSATANALPRSSALGYRLTSGAHGPLLRRSAVEKAVLR